MNERLSKEINEGIKQTFRKQKIQKIEFYMIIYVTPIYSFLKALIIIPAVPTSWDCVRVR